MKGYIGITVTARLGESLVYPELPEYFQGFFKSGLYSTPFLPF